MFIQNNMKQLIWSLNELQVHKVFMKKGRPTMHMTLFQLLTEPGTKMICDYEQNNDQNIKNNNKRNNSVYTQINRMKHAQGYLLVCSLLL